MTTAEPEPVQPEPVQTESVQAEPVDVDPVANPRGGLWSAIVMIAVAAAMFAARQGDGEFARLLQEHVSLEAVTRGVDDHLLQLLMVPLAALVVVLCRLTFGLRMLGPFRPILIAIAIQATGIALGVATLVAMLLIVTAIRPRLKGGWLPYFGRLAVMLSVVAVFLVAAVLVGANLDYEPLEKLAFFPIVVLCLTADGFAKALEKEGMPSAVSRAGATLGTAILINLVIQIDSVSDVLFDYPEFVLVEVALILLVATRLRLGLLERFQPVVGVDSE